MDVMLALTTTTGLGDGLAPDQRRMRAEFAYFGEPYAYPASPFSNAELRKEVDWAQGKVVVKSTE